MKKTIIIRVTVAVTFLIFVISSWTQSGKPDLGVLKLFSTAALACTLIFNIWDLWLWRIPWIQLIPGIPRNIRGTWKGTLTSFWVNPASGTSPSPKTVYLVVQQTASFVSVKLLTDESRSASDLATITQVDGSFALAYMYLSKPDMRVEHRSRIHHGSTVFGISGNPARRLKGRYWTDRDSKGELEFIDRNRKTLADDYDEALELF